MLRSGHKTQEEQAAFYRDVVSNPESDHRYYALCAPRPYSSIPVTLSYGDNGIQPRYAESHDFIGLGGLTYLSRVPGDAELSLILGPSFRGRGLGVRAVVALMAEAANLGLRGVVGECYVGGAVKFWQAMTLIQWRTWQIVEPFRLEHGSYTWRWERTA